MKDIFRDSITRSEVHTMIAQDKKTSQAVGRLIGWIKKEKDCYHNSSKKAELKNMFIEEDYGNV